MLKAELELLEQRTRRLIAAYRQARLEARRAQQERERVEQERDRLLALNNELRRRIEGIVERVRALETGQDETP